MAGVVESYIHTGNQIGVLLELRCQSKTTAITPEFKTLAREIAMQIAACPHVKYIRREDIPLEMVNQEKIFDKIDQRLSEITLLSQPYIRDHSLTIEDLIKLRATQLAENIFVNRFVRFAIDDFGDLNPPQPGGGVPTNPFPTTPSPLASEAEVNDDDQ